MDITWTTEAQKDFAVIRAYLVTEVPGRALSIVTRIDAAADSLIQLPERGRPGRKPDTRELLVKRLPYVIVYRITTENIEIVTLVHTSRNWP